MTLTEVIHTVAEWLRTHGLNESTATAGLMGGTVKNLIVRGGFLNGIVSALTGAITANYIAPGVALSHSFNPWSWSEGTIGFLVGMTSFLICEGTLKYVQGLFTSQKLPGGPQ